jgi:TrmH family RNA methyltransferase
MFKRIESTKNKFLKSVKALNRKKNRNCEELFLIEGARICEDFLSSNTAKFVLKNVFVSDSFYSSKKDADINVVNLIIKNGEVDRYIVNDSIFSDLTDTKTPQGVLCVIEKLTQDFSFDFSKERRIILLDHVQDPGNVGTIIRTADAAGFGAVILSDGCADLYNPKTIRATMGSFFRVNVFEDTDLISIAEKLKETGTKLFATALTASDNIFEINFPEKVAVVLGNEANGISDDLIQVCDETVKIPMEGQSESLNVSVAAGLIMYEVMKRQTKEKI